jgi:hypothetical protein
VQFDGRSARATAGGTSGGLAGHGRIADSGRQCFLEQTRKRHTVRWSVFNLRQHDFILGSRSDLFPAFQCYLFLCRARTAAPFVWVHLAISV